MRSIRWGTIALLVLALACGVGAVAATSQGRTALTDQQAEAQTRAVFLVNSELFPVLSARRLARPMTYGATWRPTEMAVRSGILTDRRFLRVRIWSPDGTIVYSSDPEIGSVDQAMAPALRQALAGRPTSEITTARFTPAAGTEPAPPEQVYETLMPLRVPDRISPVAVAQIDQSYAAIQDEAARVWDPAQKGSIAGAVFFAGAFVIALWRLGLRKPERVVAAEPGVPKPTPPTPVLAEAESKTTVDPRLREMAGEPDVALLGVRMPELYAIELARRTAQENPHTTVVMVSSYDQDRYRVRSLPDGDEVLIPKTADVDEFVGSMRVMAGFHDEVGFEFRFPLGEEGTGLEEEAPQEPAAEGVEGGEEEEESSGSPDEGSG